MNKLTLLFLLVLGISPFFLLGLGVFVLAQDEGLINPEKDYVTETITCKFPHLSGENICYNSFHYGNIERPTEGVQYQCSGVGKCDIIIRGEKGAKMKWESFCMEWVSDARIKSWVELIQNPSLTTTIDGQDKIVNFNDCTIEESGAGRILGSSFFSILREFLLKLYYGDRLGVRDGYVLCNDGEEIILDNNAPFCKTADEMFGLLEEQCENRCSIDTNKCIERCNNINEEEYKRLEGTDKTCSENCALFYGVCGAVTAHTYSGCDLDDPDKDVAIVNV